MAGNSDPLQSPPNIDIGVVANGTECECDIEGASTHSARGRLFKVCYISVRGKDVYA